jgi:hypothetical protein
MNCAKHPEVPAVAYCRTCGRAMCEACKRDVRGVIYCEDCLAARVQTAPPVAVAPAPTGGPHPAVAGVLALMPFGVSQAYNGQYARGLVYLVTFITLVWASDHVGDYFGIAIAAYVIFQFIDAIRSARYIQAGLPAPDPFGLDRLLGPSGMPTSRNAAPAAVAVPGYPPAEGAAGRSAARVPAGALILIGLGVFFLLGSLGHLRLHWLHEYWPVALIVVGVWVLVRRLGGSSPAPPPPPAHSEGEAPNGR